MSWVPAAIMAGARFLGGIWSSYTRANQSRENILLTIRAKKQMAQKEFMRNKKMWRMMKKYNTPRAQMQRIKKAGLNPNLMYGMGTVGNVGGYPTYQAPNISYRGIKPLDVGKAIQGGINAYQNIRQTNAQIDLVQEQTEIAVQTAINKEKTEYILEAKGEIKAFKAFLKSAKKAGITNKKGVRISKWGASTPELRERLIDEFLSKMDRASQKQALRHFKKIYWKNKAKYAKRGMDIGDSIQWRALISIIEQLGKALGYDTSWIDFTPKN